MTAKEKAKELFEKYKSTRFDIQTKMDSIPTTVSDYPTNLTAKICALIAVEEIMNEPAVEFNQFRLKYWQQVKTEIENL